MKLVTFVPHQQREARLGALHSDRVIDLNAAHARRRKDASPTLMSMRTLIEAGEEGMDLAREALAFAVRAGDEAVVRPKAMVSLRAPLANPPMLRCCSLFRGHHVNCRRTMVGWATGVRPAAEDITLPEIVERMPGWYKGNHLSIIGHDQDIIFPAFAARLDFELELALIVGAGGVDVAPDDFGKHVFGWSIFNDVSARDPQLEEMQLGVGPFKGKDFDTGNVLGPCIVTADAFDPTTARATARVNGKSWGCGDASDMLHKWPDVLAHRSRGERLHPGEIITSGAFTNCSGIEHDRYLVRGDVVELEVDGIGILSNRIVGAPA